MMLAADMRGERILASPGARALCPVCQSEVIAKCGEIKVHHWAHASLRDCDIWSEPESEWHYGWKKLAGLDNTEIVMSDRSGEVHRADIRINGKVIELQHSALSPSEVRAREDFYDNMIWIIDADRIGEFDFRKWVSAKGFQYYQLRGIKRSWIRAITKPVYFHFTHIYLTKIWRWEENNDPYRRSKWYPTSSDMPPEHFDDVLVKWTDSKFAKIMPKADFCKRFFGVVL